jgi:hypothetical protein
MQKIFSKWLDLLKIPLKDRHYTIYIHEQYKNLEDKIKLKWCQKTGIKIHNWKNTVFKHNPTNREITEDYIGLLRVAVSKSTNLNRRISGWTNALISLA